MKILKGIFLAQCAVSIVYVLVMGGLDFSGHWNNPSLELDLLKPKVEKMEEGAIKTVLEGLILDLEIELPYLKGYRVAFYSLALSQVAMAVLGLLTLRKLEVKRAGL